MHIHKLLFTSVQVPLKKKEEEKSKQNSEKRGCRECKDATGSGERPGERMWRTNWAIRENYEHVYGSGNIILYFKKTTILWYSVTGTSGGRQTVILQNKTDFLSQCRLMTWKSCPYSVRELDCISLWNVSTQAHLICTSVCICGKSTGFHNVSDGWIWMCWPFSMLVRSRTNQATGGSFDGRD